MNRALKHRGPDADGVSIHANVGLAHTRLSIVDLKSGAQPLISHDGRYAISFNGEIYNYLSLRSELEKKGCEFQTHTDTEVILNLYIQDGEACLQKLRGMFGFAIHDRQTGTLFLARDRLGIKPVYYYQDKVHFLAASEIKALFASQLVNPEFNPDSIKNYFNYQSSISPNTPFRDVYELPPGHQLTIESGKTPDITAYWDLEFPLDGEYESDEESYWTEKFETALQDSITSHTTGDVSIGSYLSGGIDSSAITWLLSESYPDPLETFSIHFSNESMDESPLYRKTAAHLKVKNSELLMEDNREQGYLQDLEKCIYHLEQPQRMAVDIPHFLLSEFVQDKHYKVVYTGDGADEIMGGYDCYRQDAMRFWGNQLKNYKSRRRHYLSEYTEYFAEDHIRLLLKLHKAKNQRKTIRQFGCYPAWNDFWHITDDLLPGLFSQEYLQKSADDMQMATLAEKMKPNLEGRHVLNQSLYIETKTRLPGWILWKSDRLSMAHGVEARVPFLDHPLVELAARMPPQMKLNGMDEKYILKKISSPHLPQHPTQYKKRAFYAPIREWFFTADKMAELDVYLSQDAIMRSGIFEFNIVNKLLTTLLNSQPTTMNEQYLTMKLEWVLFTVLTTQILHHQYIEKNAACFKY